MTFFELRTRGRVGCARSTCTLVTAVPSKAVVFSTRTADTGTRGSTLKLSAKPAATTFRNSTMNDRASGCDATYGTGSDASIEITPALLSTRDAIRLSIATSVVLARNGTIAPSATIAISADTI